MANPPEHVLPWLALRAQPGLSRSAAHRLLAHFGSAEAIWAARAGDLRAAVAPGLAAALARGPDLAAARRELEQAVERGLRVLAPGAPDYPHCVASIPDPPLLLWLRGVLPERPGLAIVGARRASTRGRGVARKLARAAAGAGVAVVSGLAYGIDAAAHEGALEAGGPTLAVLASGLDRPSPRGNLGLARRLLDASGAWLSEYPPGTEPAPYRFPERNRLISALSRAVLVVEAGERSGSLWTVRHALDQGRDVLAVPGPIDTASCLGSNRLLRDGAVVILDERDLLDQVASGMAPAPPSRPALRGDAARLWAALADGPAELDSLSDRLALAPGPLASALLELELAGLAGRDGSRVLRTG